MRRRKVYLQDIVHYVVSTESANLSCSLAELRIRSCAVPASASKDELFGQLQAKLKIQYFRQIQ